MLANQKKPELNKALGTGCRELFQQRHKELDPGDHKLEIIFLKETLLAKLRR